MCNCSVYQKCNKCEKKIPHKHAALIKAWADGAVIQHKGFYKWGDCSSEGPTWNIYKEYRIKPEPKPDGVMNAVMQFKGPHKSPSIRVSWEGDCPAGYAHNLELGLDVLKFTFDGETGALKSVEIV